MQSSAGTEFKPEKSRDLSTWGMVAITVLISLATAVATSSFASGSMSSKTSENERAIHELQQNTVTRREFDSFAKRLERIEDKLDKALERQR